MRPTRTGATMTAVLVGALLATASCTGTPQSLETGTAPVMPAGAVAVDPLAVVPRPAELTAGIGEPFALVDGTVVTADPALDLPATALVDGLVADTGLDLAAVTGTGTGDAGTITLTVDPAVTGTDGYRLTVDADRVEIAAAGEPGAFAAVATLRQLVPLDDPGAPREVPPVEVRDQARFAYRGAMLDVARHFFDVEEVQRYVDQLALLKINHLHLHLTDDQGWRIAIGAWPRLTEVGGAGASDGDPGGFYTQDDYRAIVAHAAARGITVVPEIDMPGHTNAALASYGELSPDGQPAEPCTGDEVGFSTLDTTSETTYRFVTDVLTEVAALTPGPYLHIGGDESDATADDDYADFVQRAAEIAAGTGKTVLGWHDIAKAGDLPPGTVAQYWSFTQDVPAEVTDQVRGFVGRGGQVVMSPADVAYLDHKYDDTTPRGQQWARGFTDLPEAYSWDPATVLDGVGEDAVIGVEATLFTEKLRTLEEVESMVFPRLAALAEVGWTAQANRDLDSFQHRLAALGPRWDAAGVTYTRVPEVDWP